MTVISAVESLLISISASTSASTATLPIFLPLAIEGSHITAAAAILGYACLGATLGTCTGLVPGFHVNSVAFLLVGIAPTLPGSPVAVGAAVLAGGIVHTFLSVVPGLVLGVPEAATAPGVLPGHRLVLNGCGHEAIRLSALGSAIALVVAVTLALPLSWIISAGEQHLRSVLPVLLIGVALALAGTESTWKARIGGLCCAVLATGFGILTLDLPAAGPIAPPGAESMLGPIFAGLFGTPVLLDALGSDGEIPPQQRSAVGLSGKKTVRAALAGAGGGALVGYLPGVSAGVAATLALGGAGGETDADETDRPYVVATSGADTATAVFAVASLVVLGSPRSGVTVALSTLGEVSGEAPAGLLTLLLIVIFAASLGIVLLVTVGEWYLTVVRRLPRQPLVGCVLIFITGLAVGFGGLLGGAVFSLSTLIGLIPPRIGVRRVHLMGVLLGPVALM